LHWFRGNGADACWTDYNGDGRIDLLTTLADSGDVLRLFRNHFNEGNNHVLLKLNATNGNKLAIGARVAVYASGKRYLQEVTAGRGIRMQKPSMLHFGIGTAPSIDSVMVRWPGSTSWERFVDVRVNALNYLEEGGKIRVNIAERQGAKAHSFHLNPNPTSGHATVSSIPAFENGTVRLYNVAGQLIMNKTGVQGTHCELDVSTLPAGVYFVECVSNGKQSRMKLVRN
jgi:hypothetical protein